MVNQLQMFSNKQTYYICKSIHTPSLFLQLHKINASDTPSPLCVHDTTHLFTCTHVPTKPTVTELWMKPTYTVTLLVAWKNSLAGERLGLWQMTPLNLIEQLCILPDNYLPHKAVDM